MEKIYVNTTNRRTAIVSYGNRITLYSDHVRSVVLSSLRDFYIDVYKREKVDFLSRKTKKEDSLSYYKNIKDYMSAEKINEYDEIIIYNSPFNLFGGIFSEEMLDTFKAIMNFKGEIYYFIDDPKFPCIDIAKNFLSRAARVDEESDTVVFPLGKGKFYDLKLSSLMKFSESVWPKIIIAYAGIDYNTYYDMWNKTHKTLSDKNRMYDNSRWLQVDLNAYMAVTELLEEKLKDYDKSNARYDLVYYGNVRHTERDKIIKSIFCSDESSTRNLLFGYKMDWPNCDYREYVPHDVLYEECCKNALATVIIGDLTHNNTLMSVRFFESMMIDLVAFIWSDYDTERQFVKNQELKDFIYFSSAEELKEKIDKIRNDNEFYRRIVRLQREEIVNGIAKDYIRA